MGATSAGQNRIAAALFMGMQSSPKKTTIRSMHIAVFAMRLLEWMFFVGLVGSAVVVLISFIEDGKELIGKDEPTQ